MKTVANGTTDIRRQRGLTIRGFADALNVHWETVEALARGDFDDVPEILEHVTERLSRVDMAADPDPQRALHKKQGPSMGPGLQ